MISYLDLSGSLVSPLGFLTLALAFIGSASDLRTRRIPNWLTLWGFAMAMTLRLLGNEGLLSGLAGAGIAFGIALPLFAVSGIGAGDVKYLTAFGAVLGTGRIFPALLLVSVLCGVLALVSALISGRARVLLADSAGLALHTVSRGLFGRRRSLLEATEAAGTQPIPLGVGIAAGCLLVWFL